MLGIVSGQVRESFKHVKQTSRNASPAPTSKDAFTRMAVDVVKGRHLHTHVTKHEVFEEGCRVSAGL